MRDPVFYKIIDNEDDEYYQLSNPTFDVQEFPRWVVELAARDYFENHGGWDSEWPLQISLHKAPNCKEICRFLMSLENEPVFFANEIKVKDQK